VAGTFSSKQYFCNQENINKYTSIVQRNTFLDKEYAELPKMDTPSILQETKRLSLKTILPQKTRLQLDYSIPLLLYTSYNLDPNWRKDMQANRVLLLEPSHFRQFPVSEKVIDFILSLANNIKGLQVFFGEINEIPGLHQLPAIYSKEHPAFKHFPGKKDERNWLFPEVKGAYNSFFTYWKKCEHLLKKKPGGQLALLRA
jgi:deoxyribodipyrimidine photo-lyase